MGGLGIPFALLETSEMNPLPDWSALQEEQRERKLGWGDPLAGTLLPSPTREAPSPPFQCDQRFPGGMEAQCLRGRWEWASDGWNGSRLWWTALCPPRNSHVEALTPRMGVM